jgi:hypothetical protein
MCLRFVWLNWRDDTQSCGGPHTHISHLPWAWKIGLDKPDSDEGALESDGSRQAKKDFLKCSLFPTLILSRADLGRSHARPGC